MFVLSIIMFYSHRDFSNEYFNRSLIANALENNSLGYQNVNDVSNVEDFIFFMNQTIA